jgi:predicted regulator of Ras-like GTPase activity (Roadblock/LC7/MglB family)
MSDAYARALERVSRVHGVRGALLVEAEAGVPVLVELAAGVNGTAVAALAASLFLRTAQASGSAGFGTLKALQVEAAGGHVLVGGAGDLLIVAIAERDAQLGLVRLVVQQAAEALR